MKSLLLILLSSLSPLFSNEDIEATFTQYYENASWGRNEHGEGYSGPGSQVSNTARYMKFLQDFVKKNKIKTIVDVGCGDWTFSQYLDWNGAEYTGIDIVKPVIEKNIKKFSSPKVRFIHSNGIEMDLPKADLLICKDVLQHLPDREIHKFLKQLSKYKHCLITNDIDPKTKSSENIELSDFTCGRFMDLTKYPFNLEGRKVLSYKAGMSTKQVLHIKK